LLAVENESVRAGIESVFATTPQYGGPTASAQLRVCLQTARNMVGRRSQSLAGPTLDCAKVRLLGLPRTGISVPILAVFVTIGS
jgi:hypothetical protein